MKVDKVITAVLLSILVLLAIYLTSLQLRLPNMSEDEKEFLQDEAGDTYFAGYDSYLYYRLSEDIAEHGFPGDDIKDGAFWDFHRTAYKGTNAHDSFNVYLNYYFYRVLGFFYKDISFKRSLFYLNILLAVLLVFPVFFLTKKITGNVGGFFSSFLLIALSVFPGRISSINLDTDIYTLLLPLLSIFFFVLSVESKKSTKKIFYAAISAVFLVFLSKIWKGWWYVDVVIILSFLLYFIYLSVFKEEESKSLISLIIFLIIQLLFLNLDFVKSSLLLPFNTSYRLLSMTHIYYSLIFFVFLALLTLLLYHHKDLASQLKKNKLLQFFIPFFYFVVFSTVIFLFFTNKERSFVTELRSPFLAQAASIFGGWHVFLFSIAGLVVILTLFRNHKFLSFALVSWFFLGMYAFSSSLRFFVITIAPFCIAFGVFAFWICSKAPKLVRKLNQKIAYCSLLAVFLFIVLFPFSRAIETAGSNIFVNDAWHDTLKGLKSIAPKDSVIFAWWDHGYIVQSLADRRTVFDGGSQFGYTTYFMSRALTSHEENLSVGIFRMLACSSPADVLLHTERLVGGREKAVNLIEAFAEGNHSGDEGKIAYSFAVDEAMLLNLMRSINLIKKTILERDNESDINSVVKQIADSSINNKVKALDFSKEKTEELYAEFDNAAYLLKKFTGHDRDKAYRFLAELIEETSKRERKEAEKIIKEKLAEKVDARTEEILGLIRCETPPKSYLLLSDDMVAKSQAWSAFGKSMEAYLAFNFPSEVSGYEKVKYPCSQHNDLITCNNGVLFNQTSRKITVKGRNPRFVLAYVDGNLYGGEHKDYIHDTAVMIYPSKEGYFSITMTSDFASTIFNKLYFLNGQDLQGFSKVMFVNEMDTSLAVYEINFG